MSKTYRFTTFQELLDRVPGDRIADCLREMGECLGTAKQLVELHWEISRKLAEKDGKDIGPMPERALEWSEQEWIDDGKGELGANLVMPDGSEFLSVDILPKQETQ